MFNLSRLISAAEEHNFPYGAARARRGVGKNHTAMTLLFKQPVQVKNTNDFTSHTVGEGVPCEAMNAALATVQTYHPLLDCTSLPTYTPSQWSRTDCHRTDAPRHGGDVRGLGAGHSVVHVPDDLPLPVRCQTWAGVTHEQTYRQ